MDERLVKIVNKTVDDFGLEGYTLESHSIHKERNSNGGAYYILNMEFFPGKENIVAEDDLNPDGTAVISYLIQKGTFQSVIFVGGKTFSAKHHFVEKTADEVARWVENETGLRYGAAFKLTGVLENGFRFKAHIDGVQLSSSGMIEIEFDELGRLTSYYIDELIPQDDQIIKEAFSLTLEEIEPFVKEQLQLVEIPIESNNEFAAIYAMEEVYIVQSDKRAIPFEEQERSDIPINEVIMWDTPLSNELMYIDLSLTTETTIEEAFNHIDVNDKLTISTEQIEESKRIVRDVLRSEYPTESNVWTFAKIRLTDNFIEAHCHLANKKSTLFNRKIVLFINPENMKVINIMDNGELFEEVFGSFSSAQKAKVTHDEAFEKLLSYITLDPVYVYDPNVGNYVLCGLLDAAEGVDAVTGEIVSLADL